MNKFNLHIVTTITTFFALLCIVMSEGKETRPAFIKDIINFYGENDTLAVESLESMMESMKRGRRVHGTEEQNLSENAKCLSLTELLSEFGLSNVTQLSAEDLKGICPAVLHQGLLSTCPLSVPHQQVDYHVWGYSFLAVTIINLSSLMGLLLTPFVAKPYFPKLLTYFIGLAIGTLFSNAILQLIPEALGFDPKVDNYVPQAIGIFGGFYLLYFTERILKMVLKTEHEHSNSHLRPVEPQLDRAIQNCDAAGKSEVATGTSVVIINSLSSSMTSMASSAHTEQDIQVSNGFCPCLRGPPLRTIKTVAWMISLSDALHNFIDGLVIGASFSISVLAGFSTSIAIVCEEFPHELGDFVILLNAGMSVAQAVLFNLLSALSCYVGLVLGILASSSFAPHVIFAIAGGMFLYIALADMFPEMNSIMIDQENSTRNRVLFFLIQNAGLLSGFSVILLITLFAGDINLG